MTFLKIFEIITLERKKRKVKTKGEKGLDTKITYGSLKLKLEPKCTDITFHNRNIEVLQYLPAEKKMNLIEDTLSVAVDSYGFISPLKEELAFYVNIIKYYTNISFTEKQSKDFANIYDNIKESKLLSEVLKAIPEDEFNDLFNMEAKMKEFFEKSNTSIASIIHNLSQMQAPNLDQIKELMNQYKAITDKVKTK